MNPFFFGSSDGQLFGAHDPPGAGGRRGVVLCQPVGREYLLSHASLRQLARRLAETGWHALRFDYFGTGDSAGDFEETEPGRWVEDIGVAIDELKDLAQVRQVSLVGLRLGATLAARSAGNRDDVERLVLWEPVVHPAEWLAEIGAARDGTATEAAGIVLTAEMRRRLEALDMTTFDHPLPATLVLSGHGDTGRHAPLADHLRSTGTSVTVDAAPDPAFWAEEWTPGGVRLAVGSVARIVEWLA